MTKIMTLSQIKLKSCDGFISDVGADVVKQMVTIKTMLEDLGSDEDSEEEVLIPNVRGAVLEKIINWTEFHANEDDLTKRIAWYNQFFYLELIEIFDIIIAADYLDVETLLSESCRHVITENDKEDLEEAKNVFGDSKLAYLLENYRRDHGYEVIVTLHDEKYLKYFDPKVWKAIIRLIS